MTVRALEPKRWNTRFLAYARSQGTPDPEAMLALDRIRYPGGVMAGYILWNSARWDEFCAERGIDSHYRSLHGAEYDAWLAKKVP